MNGDQVPVTGPETSARACKNSVRKAPASGCRDATHHPHGPHDASVIQQLRGLR